jgi:hypothetical protein
MTVLVFSTLSANMIGITVAQADHDIAVVSVTPSLTSVRVGELVNITVVVENKGTNNETFDVTVYYDSSTIKTETVTNLVAGTNTSLTFTWNTTDVREEIYAKDKKEKAYTINATASTIPDETDTEDNTLVSPSKVRVKSQYITVIPQSTVDPKLEPGMNYTVSIYTDYNGSDVWSWVFELTYNPTVLEGIEVVNGDLITTDKHPDALFEAGDFDNTLGKQWQTNAFFYYIEKPIPTTYGPGILANVTFRVVGTGDSEITIDESKTKLTGYNAITEEFYEIVSDWKPNIGHILHGYFRNTVKAVTHDVAILSVTPSNTTVTKGDLVNITVVVENQGTVPETITVAAYYDSIDPNYRIATTKTVQSLEAGANASLTFVWDTTDILVVGTYSIWAEAGTVPGETDTEDNRREGEDTVTVKALRGQRVPIELAIGIVVVVVLAGAVVLYAVRRRRKRTPE